MIKLNVKKFSEFSLLIFSGLIFLIALNLVFFLLFGDTNIDLTKNKKYSLSNETVRFLDKNKKQVNIRFFVSKDLQSKNPKLAEYAEYLRKLFVEYKNKSNGYIDLSMVDVVPFENSQFEAEKYGITEFNLGDGIKYQYLGVSFSNIDGRYQSISQLNPERKNIVEDDITRMLSVITEDRKPYVGIISPLFSVADGNNPVRNVSNWPFVDAIEKFGYDVVPIRATTPYIDDAMDVVILLYPVEVDTSLRYALDQYLVKGGSLVILMDAFSEERFRDQEEYYSYKSGLTQFLEHYGVLYNEYVLVGDNVNSRTVIMDGKKVQYPMKINIKNDMLADHLINKNVETVFYNHGGFFEYQKRDNMVATVIAKTSNNSGVLLAGKITDLGYNELIKDYAVTNENYILSLLIEGKFNPYYSYPPINDSDLISKLPIFIGTPENYGKLLLIGDADFVNEALWNKNLGNKNGVFNITYSSDNLLFLRNILDYMSVSKYTNIAKKNIDNDSINLVDVFQRWSVDFYAENKREITEQLYDVKNKLISFRDNKAEMDLLSVKKLKDEEKLVRKEMELSQNLRKIVYLTGEKYKFFMTCFSVFVIFVLPMLVVLSVWQIYALYNRKIVKKTKEYVDD